jgi:mono/diheme cytochrome c family protein
MKTAVRVLAILVIAGLAASLYLSRPQPQPPSAFQPHTPDLANGKRLYTAGGCMSCHLPPEADAGADKTLPSGGHPLATPVGILYPPNITPDVTTGIGTWSDADFVNAMQLGLDPHGRHLVPAFPYTSYARMAVGDVLDIKAWLMSLPAVFAPNRPPDVDLLWLVRRGIGLWKFLALDNRQFTPDPRHDAAWNTGAYLVKGPGHCGECHTPRNIFLVSRMDHWLEGGRHPDGTGKVPSLHDLAGRGRYKDAADLALAFQWGEAFGYDKMSSGGMGSVRANLAQMPQADLEAIADYLMSLK